MRDGLEWRHLLRDIPLVRPHELVLVLVPDAALAEVGERAEQHEREAHEEEQEGERVRGRDERPAHDLDALEALAVAREPQDAREAHDAQDARAAAQRAREDEQDVVGEDGGRVDKVEGAEHPRDGGDNVLAGQQQSGC